jgi:hypothetical protein
MAIKTPQLMISGNIIVLPNSSNNFSRTPGTQTKSNKNSGKLSLLNFLLLESLLREAFYTSCCLYLGR